MPTSEERPQPGAPAASRVRTEPVQERSAARIDTLLDAAADVVETTGVDRLTTAMVAERAGASIGTVYRYFPDRIVLLEALRDRTVRRFSEGVVARIRTEAPERWWDVVDIVVDTITEVFRTVPGARVIRFDGSDRRAAPEHDEFPPGYFARRFAEILADEFDLASGPDLVFHLEIAVEMGDALIRRAFLLDSHGEERFLDEARVVVREYLSRRYGASGGAQDED